MMTFRASDYIDQIAAAEMAFRFAERHIAARIAGLEREMPGATTARKSKELGDQVSVLRCVQAELLGIKVA